MDINTKDIKNPINDVGSRIKFFRKKKNITLKELSEKTLLSIGYLSNLERNTCSPTLINIQKICQFLDISITDLLENNMDAQVIIKKNNRKVILYEENKVKYESIHYQDSKMEALCITMQPNFESDKKWSHNYDEIGIVSKGTMEIIIDNGISDKIYRLEEGDSLYVKAGTSHKLCNKSNIISESFWVRIFS